MNNRKRLHFVVMVLSLLLGQLISNPGVAQQPSQGVAEYQSYVPLVMRSSFVPSVGELDTDFGDDGLVTSSFTADTAFGNAIAIQEDGKLLVAGSFEVQVNNMAFILLRYNTDGSLDSSFGGGNGWVTTDLSLGSEQLNDLALQEDGKIVVAGSSEFSGESDFAVARYNADGSLDTSFDEDGWLVTDFGDGDSAANVLLVQPDGKILVVGTAAEGLLPYFDDFALARYNTDGSLDTSFGMLGKVQANYGNYEFGYALALQADGKIVAGGMEMTPGIGWSSFEFILARFSTNGILDSSFDEDGWLTTDFYAGGGPEGCEDLLIQPDGQIVAAGWANNNDTGLKVFALARYNPDGSLDTGFDEDGMVVSIFSNDDYFADAIALQADGKLVLAGYVNLVEYTFGVGDIALARYNTDGSLDTSFSEDGWLTTDFIGYDNRSHDVALQQGGEMVVVGEAGTNIALARYGTDGSLDNTFDGDGMLITELTVDSEGGRAVAWQSDGKIVVGGFGWDGVSGDQFILARYKPDGSLDGSFGETGFITTNLSAYDDQIKDILLQTDGKILAVGCSRTSGYGPCDFAVARYNTDGSLDSSFDEDGWLTTDFAGDDDQAYGVALQTDGKIVVVGSTHVNLYDYDIALARYNTDGSLDTSFDEDGKQSVDFNGYADAAISVVIQPDEKILLSGQVSTYSKFPYQDNAMALLRLNPDGSLDTSFDEDGIVRTDFTTGTGGEAATDLLLQPNGKIVATGWVNLSGTADYYFALLRYTSDGMLDTTFNGDGWVLTSLDSDYNYAQAVKLQPDGKFLVAGFVYISGFPDNEAIFALARFNKDGSLDTSFSQDGWLTIDLDGFDDRCYDMALQPDGKVVLAGESGGDFALVRYK